MLASLHSEEQDAVVCCHGDILVIPCNEIRVAHPEKVLVLYTCRVLTCSDTLDVDIADVIRLALLVVEEDVYIFAVIHSRYHKFT